MEKQLPKNVRQIGNVSDNPRIYVEDYVDTFLNQLCDRTQEPPIGAFLIGEIVRQEEQDCVYISGAVQMKEVTMADGNIVLVEEVFKEGYEQCKEFFGDAEILGWFLTMPRMSLSLNDNLVQLQESIFPNEYNVFIMKESLEKEEVYYSYKFKELMELGGHYIYYEKNPCMQNYMIASRKKIGVTPSEVVEDRAAKDFRGIVRDKLENSSQKHGNKLVYGVSTFLIVVVLVIGITAINNYDKMKSVQSSLDHITKTVEGQDREPQTKETSGQVVNGGGSDTPRVSPPSNPPEASGEDIYIVEKGDTLAKISKKAYGDTDHVEGICKMNGLSDGNLIFIGQKLLLP